MFYPPKISLGENIKLENVIYLSETETVPEINVNRINVCQWVYKHKNSDFVWFLR